MTKKEEKIVNAQAAPANPELLPGSANDDAVIRGILADSMKRSAHSREQIAEHMSWLLSTKVTVDMLNNFTADGKLAHRFPLAWLRSFCQSTGDWRLLQHLAEQSLFILLNKEDGDMITLAEQVIERERAGAEVSRIAKNVIKRRLG